MAGFHPEFGAKFTLTGADGTIAVFNDTTDPNYVGVLTKDIEGLDSAEVRDAGDVLTGADGGVQGPNYFGRRPIVIEGLVYGHASASARGDKLARLERATLAMRSDAVLSWTPTGATDPVSLNVRRQLPLRVSGAWNKTFQIGMVAADPRIYGPLKYTHVTANTRSGAIPVVNGGNFTSYPYMSIYGPWSSSHSGLGYVLRTFGSDIQRFRFVQPSSGTIDDLMQFDFNPARRTAYETRRSFRKNLFTTPSFATAVTAALTGTAGTTLVTNVNGPATPFSTLVSDIKVATFTASGTPASVGGQSAVFTMNGTTGDKTTISWSAQSAAVSRTMKVLIDWYNASNVFVSSETLTGSATSTSAWTRQVAVGTRPATATKMQVTLILQPVSGNCTNGEVHYVDGVVMEAFSLFTSTLPSDGSYFDGSTPGVALTYGAWEGTANNSASYLLNAFKDPGSLNFSIYRYIDSPQSTWWGLEPGTNSVQLYYLDNTASSATADGSGGGGMSLAWRDVWL